MIFMLHFDPYDLEKLVKSEMNLSVDVSMSADGRRSVNYRDSTHTRVFYNDLNPSKVGQGDLFLLCHQGLLVGLCV